MDWIKHFIIEHSDTGLKINDLKQGIRTYKSMDILQEYVDDIPNGKKLDTRIIEVHLTNRLNGKIHGTLYVWKRNQILSIEEAVEDKYQGIQLRWYENGKLHSVEKLKNDKYYGLQYKWYENGKLCSIENYKNDKKCGMQYKWNRSGKIKSIVNHLY